MIAKGKPPPSQRETFFIAEAGKGQGLPQVLALVAAATDRATALAFAGAFGGRRVYVPRPETIKQDHEWALALGLEPARAVADALFPGESWTVPHGPLSGGAQRRAEIFKLRDGGMSAGDIAHTLRMDQRSVRRVLAAGPKAAVPSAQGDLFEV
jgi:Mor family transcriptional regulator